MKTFNTSGPNIFAEHYTLYRQALVEKGVQLVHQKRYFTIWAPRQTGKSTYFKLLAEELKKQGYLVGITSVEDFKTVEMPTILNYFQYRLSEDWEMELNFESIPDLFQIIEKTKDKKLVLVVDEIENYNPKYISEFLHSIRKVYHSREHHSLKSVLLVGVSNILGVIQDNASPFNIADNLQIPYFTDEETFELLGQHETETGQLFEPKVKAKISEITANQPGLVNAFAKRLVEEYVEESPINYENYLRVEDWFLNKAIDKNASNIINKAKQYKPFAESLLFTEAKIPFQIEREEIKVLHTNGLIKEDENGYVTFWVPFYKKKLYQAFYPYTNGEGADIEKRILLEEFEDENGDIRFDKIIEAYRAYVKKRGFNRFREKDAQGNYKSIKEAALVYSFETYIQAFLQVAEGKTYLEADTGLGKSDLIIYLNQREYLIEVKIFTNQTKFRNGKKQLAYYCKSLGLNEGVYLVFSPDHLKFTEITTDSIENIEGIAIYTYMVPYNEEKDF